MFINVQNVNCHVRNGLFGPDVSECHNFFGSIPCLHVSIDTHLQSSILFSLSVLKLPFLQAEGLALHYIFFALKTAVIILH